MWGRVDGYELREFLAINGADIPSRSSGRAMKSSEHFLHVARHGYGDSGAVRAVLKAMFMPRY
jgi:hypothetical protein